MSGHAFILGGTGQIGRAVALDLLACSWDVTVSHRGIHAVPGELVEHGARIAVLDRDNPGDFARALGSGTDALIDTTAYDLGHACQLIAVQGNVGNFVVISSSSVYRDGLGRTLDEASQNGFPELPDPIPETHPTVDPGPKTYSTRKITLERHLLDESAAPVTILRPCAVCGLGSRHPREWWLVKRILDRRPAIPLAFRGISRFHTSSVANIAALTRVAVELPGHRVLNIADPLAPSIADIAVIARHLGYDGNIAEVGEQSYPPAIGRTPWSVPRPFVLDCRAALDLGYSPVTTYADAVKPVCDWLVATVGDGDWKERFPVLASYPRDLFDYAAEDGFFGT
jgi:nucleoside-diphosphate-sugar epimerase